MKSLLLIALFTIIYGNFSKKGHFYLIPDKAVKGDFNGDGKTEYAWLLLPELAADGESCIGNCDAKIVFSDKNIKPIVITNCISGKPDNPGDLNNDGKDEIGILPGWFTSCWRAYQVYTLKKQTWEYAVPPFMTHCNQWDDNVKPIVKNPAKKGFVIIHYSEFENNNIVIKTKSELIK